MEKERLSYENLSFFYKKKLFFPWALYHKGKIMKNFSILILFAVGLAFAQAGIQGGSDGIHQQNAYTLGQWNFFIGTGGDVGIGKKTMSGDGKFVDNEGNTWDFDKMSFELSGNVYAGIGLLEFLDFGFSFPLYYEYAWSAGGPTNEYYMRAGSRGDMDLWLKFRAPFGDETSIFSAAFMFDAYAPTGEIAAGVRPRHVWYISDEEDPKKVEDYTHAFTADDWAFGGNLILTLDLSRMNFPLRWNAQLGYVYTLGKGESNALTYSTGLNLLPASWIDIFAEFSGETRVGKSRYPRDPLVDPMLLTPGFRFHLPYHIDFAIGVDIAVRNFTGDYDCDDYTLQRISERGKKAKFCYVSTPPYAPTASLSVRLGATVSNADDSDGDGIVDSLDRCPHTKSGVKVDSLGCPIDTDKDGVADFMDKCPNTPENASVNAEGCEMDFDDDGVPDSKDMCPNSPKGSTVDPNTGCPVDSDKDGVPDVLDKCANTEPGAVVDSLGCPMDSDADGIADGVDRCPNTPAGAVVGATGCPLDEDGDGVPDGLDQCPSTIPGAYVDSVGCPMDFDRDGVYDGLDKCPNTLPTVQIDSVGCPLSKKEDLDQLKKGIGFLLNSAKLTAESYATLDDIVYLMNAIPQANLEVHGHADITGPKSWNDRLSLARAQSVVNYFVDNGIDASRLRAIGYGSDRPIASNETRYGRRLNRRVELVPFEK